MSCLRKRSKAHGFCKSWAISIPVDFTNIPKTGSKASKRLRKRKR